MLNTFWKFFQFVFWPAFVGVTIWGFSLSIPEYQQLIEYHIEEAKAEMEYFDIPMNRRPPSTQELDLLKLYRAKQHHIMAQAFGASAEDTVFLDIEEKIKAIKFVVNERAQDQIQKNVVVPYDKFWGKFDQGLDQLNKHDTKTKTKK